MHHYELGWHDENKKVVYSQICEYAENAFEAVRHAREDVPYLQDNPFSLHMIREIKNEKLTN